MNQDATYFTEFSAWLRHAREAAGITRDQLAENTRLPKDVIEKIEAGELTFESEAYVLGYLKLYAEAVGIYPETVNREFRAILSKIEFLTQDRAVLATTGEDTLQPIQPEVVIFDPSQATLTAGTQLDHAVKSKIRRERLINYAVTGGSVALALLSIIFILQDDRREEVQIASTIAKYEKKAEVIQPTKREPRKRLSFFVSEPLLTQEEKERLDSLKGQLEADSMNIAMNRVSRKWIEGQKLVPITVQEAARDLEKRLKSR